MTQAHQLPAQAAPNANVTSTGWTGAGISQGAPGWCFAAAEQMVQRAFGVTINQAQLAHDVLLARGRSGDPAGTAQRYYTGLRAINNQHNPVDLSWPSVQQYVRQDPALFDLLRKGWSSPTLLNRTCTRTNAPDLAQIVRTIDAGGLVMIGSEIHWKVVYGYASGPTGAVTSLKVYDPWESGTDHPAMSLTTFAAQNISETIYVTG